MLGLDGQQTPELEKHLLCRQFDLSFVADCFHFLCAAMDSAASFAALCSKVKLAEKVCAALEPLGFKSPAEFYWALKDGADDTSEAILDAAGIDLSSAPSKLQCVEAGRLRRLLSECKLVCEAPQPGPPTPAEKMAPSLLGMDVGPRLSGDVLQQLWSEFAKKYPAEVVEGDARPGKALVQMVYAQKCQQELKYIPWKRILSEAQADRVKQGSTKRDRSFLDLLADAAGHADPPEQEPSPSPFGVQRLLMLRAVAWALIGWCHLGGARRLVHAFMELYGAHGLHAVGLRGPSLVEAEAADGEICRQLNALLGAGFSLDQALHELVAVRNCLHIWLQPKPKLLPQSDLYNKKSKRPLPQPAGKSAKIKNAHTPGLEAPRAKKVCFAFKKSGKCSFGENCRFEQAE